ncbi:hypothetical protein B0H11DRAFT_2060384 [Mycena galericulata]|nr:hypothetical protein B0H11DRAFT_2060384 [Mycena galericulata]
MSGEINDESSDLEISDESSELTDLSDSEDMDIDIPPDLTQKTYDDTLPLMKEFGEYVENVSPELKSKWKEVLDDTTARARYCSHTVAIVGRTGVGKSTLINALLNNQLLSASASGACTAVTTEISYKDVRATEAVIEFIDRDDWRTALTRLIEDVTDKSVDTEEETGDLSDFISPAHQAREKLYGVYPNLKTVDPSDWNVDQLMSDEEVDRYLGLKAIAFTASKAANFQKQIEQFMASALSTSRAFWPLVKRISIRGKFEVLSTGIILVDLPGYGDVDQVRDQMANEYLKSANSIFLVAGITRAKDDSEMHSRLHKQLHETIVDGRVREKSIALILTGADGTIGSNECTLPESEQKIVDQLKEEALKLNNEIGNLRAKKDRTEKSRSNNKDSFITKYKDKIREKEEKKEEKNKKRTLLLANGRNQIVAAALQNKYELVYRDLHGLPVTKPVPPIPIFCLGSRDYLCLSNLEPDEPATFSQLEETGIPRLKSYLQRDGECRNLKNAIWVVSNFCVLLTQASLLDTNTASDDAKSSHIVTILSGLDDRCRALCREVITKIEEEYEGIEEELKKAVAVAERASAGIFEQKARKMKWNQYRAMMRMHGQYDRDEGGNLNYDLVSTVKPAVSKTWTLAVNAAIPSLLINFYQALQDEFTETIKLICKKYTTYSATNITKSLGLEQSMIELRTKNNVAATGAQRQGSRVWDTEVKARLVPQYEKALAQKGAGMYRRMKAASFSYDGISCLITYLVIPGQQDLYSDVSSSSIRRHHPQCPEVI